MSPVLTSTPRPGPMTQEMVDRMLDLRHVDDVAVTNLQPLSLALQQENEDLKSELAAAKLQLEDYEIEMRELRQQISARPQHNAPLLPPPPQDFADGYQVAISKKKTKEKKKRETARLAAELTLPPGCVSIGDLPPPPPPPPSALPSSHDPVAAYATRPPGCDSINLPPLPSRPPPQQQQQQQPLPNVFIYHDSNLKTTAAEITTIINSINNNNNNNSSHTSYNIILQDTFTLPQTLAKMKRTTYKNNDKIIINIMTNDARNTKTRQRRSPQHTKQLQTDIIRHLSSFVPSGNITILESPPLLDSPSSDIYHYNSNSFSLSQQMGVHFAGTLIGEQHLWRDGYHVLRNFRPLLVKSVAAAVVGVNPRKQYGLARPPFGQYGPWPAPKGTGVLPTYRDHAMAKPFLFRQAAAIRPLMDPYIRGP